MKDDTASGAQQEGVGAGVPDPVEPSAPPGSLVRRRIYEILEGAKDGDRASMIFDHVLVVLIILNVIAFMAETVPSIEARYGPWLATFESFSVAFFTIEYVARLWSAVEVPYLARLPGWRARLAWAMRPYLIIDLIAVLPYFLHHLFGLDLRIVRLLRVLRLLRLSRYSPAMHTLARVVYGERRALVGASYLLAAAVTFASTGIYYLEHEAQPDKFGSVPESAWWAIATLTTVGYGDLVPVTAGGKIFGSIVMVCGLCILALPVAIISTGFAQEVNRRDFVINWSLMSRVPVLANLDAFQIAEVMPLFHAHNVPPRTEIVAAGSPGDAIYFIAGGKVQFVSDVLEFSYGTGDFFGVAATLHNDTHYGAFRTVGRCRLLKLYKEDFRRLQHVAPEVARHLHAAATERQKVRRALQTTGHEVKGSHGGPHVA
jgi:voltage-gated potassium channel